MVNLIAALMSLLPFSDAQGDSFRSVYDLKIFYARISQLI